MRLDTIINRDALCALRELPAESVHCCVTSPPYYGCLLRHRQQGHLHRPEKPERQEQAEPMIRKADGVEY